MKKSFNLYVLVICVSILLNLYFSYRIYERNSLISEIGDVYQKQKIELGVLRKKVLSNFKNSTIPIDSVNSTFLGELEDVLILRYFASECQSCLKGEKELIDNLGSKTIYIYNQLRFGDLDNNDEKIEIEMGQFVPSLDQKEKMYYLYIDSISKMGYYYFPEVELPETSLTFIKWIHQTFKVESY